MKIGFFRCNRSFTTQVESATQNPVWAAKHVFANISRQDFLDVQLQVSVWNFSNNIQHECIGKNIFVFQQIVGISFFCLTFSKVSLSEIHNYFGYFRIIFVHFWRLIVYKYLS